MKGLKLTELEEGKMYTCLLSSYKVLITTVLYEGKVVKARRMNWMTGTYETFTVANGQLG